MGISFINKYIIKGLNFKKENRKRCYVCQIIQEAIC